MPRPRLQVDPFAIPVFAVERAVHFYSQTLALKLVSAFDGDDQRASAVIERWIQS
jgi:catechol 2,3-dioxygenase-like lactoylglutathione lyase family enzyme